MKELKKIWAFGIPYIKPYRFRFVLGIALSIFFGVSNGLFVLSINTLFNRLTPAPAQTLPVAQIELIPATETVSFETKIKAALKEKKSGRRQKPPGRFGRVAPADGAENHLETDARWLFSSSTSHGRSGYG